MPSCYPIVSGNIISFLKSFDFSCLEFVKLDGGKRIGDTSLYFKYGKIVSNRTNCKTKQRMEWIEKYHSKPNIFQSQALLWSGEE